MLSGPAAFPLCTFGLPLLFLGVLKYQGRSSYLRLHQLFRPEQDKNLSQIIITTAKADAQLLILASH